MQEKQQRQSSCWNYHWDGEMGKQGLHVKLCSSELGAQGNIISANISQTCGLRVQKRTVIYAAVWDIWAFKNHVYLFDLWILVPENCTGCVPVHGWVMEGQPCLQTTFIFPNPHPISCQRSLISLELGTQPHTIENAGFWDMRQMKQKQTTNSSFLASFKDIHQISLCTAWLISCPLGNF